MKFLHAPKVPPVAKQPPMAQPQMPPQQGVHPMGVTPGAIAAQPQMMTGGFGYGYGGMMPQQMPIMQQPTMIMPQTMPMVPPYQPTMMPQVGMVAPPTLMPGMTYGGVV